MNATAQTPPPRRTGLLLLTVAFGFAVMGSIGVTVAYFLGVFDPEPEPTPVVEVDAGPPDAGPPDAGPPDAGPPDAGPPDAGPPDAGPPPPRGTDWWHNTHQERSRGQ
ncbi:MAG: hypothetical protein AB8I08_27690 [Sandaracinaceae bacterium]